LAEDAEGLPVRIGEALVAAIRHEFPRIERVRAHLIFDPEQLASMAGQVRRARAARLEEIASTTEETVEQFTTCVGCSPFAPDHVCILTPERSPQCGRAYEMIKTGALYGYDDTSNIHHRALHAEINSFGTCARGEALDPAAGEWSGVNEAAARLTGGRTRRIQLHSLEQAPHTGCGCFRLVMFKTDVPRPGIGIMDRGYKGRAPDGRTWVDLHYALAGKQTAGIAGASAGYLGSGKFLAAHGGWDAVVWVSDKIAAIAGDRLPENVSVGQETAED
jgi:acetyl-CoA decarbonylase/synthase complex subunit beta